MDLDGLARPLDGNLNGVAVVDIGACESLNPAADSDDDGVLDATELIAGTNPTDAASVLRLSLSLVPPGEPRRPWVGPPVDRTDLQRRVRTFVGSRGQVAKCLPET